MTQILGISQAGFYWSSLPASLNTWLRAFPRSPLVSFIYFLGACLPDYPVTFGTANHSLDETFRRVVFICSQLMIIPGTTVPCDHCLLPQLCRHWYQWWWWTLCVSFSLILSRPLWRGFRPPVIQSPSWQNKCLNFCESCIAAEVVTFFSRDAQSREKLVLAIGEISKLYLSGTDLCSEYQSHTSPAFSTTPPGWPRAASASQVQKRTSLLLHLPTSSVPHLRKWHFSAFKEMLESFWHLLLPQSWILPAGYFSNLFTTLPPHCCHPFHTTMISWLRYSCSLLAGLPPPHSWRSSISFNNTVSSSKTQTIA